MVAAPAPIEVTLALAIAQRLVEDFGYAHSSGQKWGPEGYLCTVKGERVLTSAEAQSRTEEALGQAQCSITLHECLHSEILRGQFLGPCGERGTVVVSDHTLTADTTVVAISVTTES